MENIYLKYTYDILSRWGIDSKTALLFIEFTPKAITTFIWFFNLLLDRFQLSEIA